MESITIFHTYTHTPFCSLCLFLFYSAGTFFVSIFIFLASSYFIPNDKDVKSSFWINSFAIYEYPIKKRNLICKFKETTTKLCCDQFLLLHIVSIAKKNPFLHYLSQNGFSFSSKVNLSNNSNTLQFTAQSFFHKHFQSTLTQ